MDIRLYSDIHQELKSTLFEIGELPDEEDHILILSGDIITLKHLHQPHYQDYFKRLSERFKAILYVFGNHEYYGHKIGAKYTLKAVDALSHLDNLHILSRHTKSVVIDGVKFVGATLWTNARRGYMNKDISNDFKKISYHNGGDSFSRLNPSNWRQEFDADLAWISKETQENVPTVVVTHHAPILEAVDDSDPEGQYDVFYRSDLGSFIENKKHILLWTYGHIHSKNSHIVGKTLVKSNPIGYNDTIDSESINSVITLTL